MSLDWNAPLAGNPILTDVQQIKDLLQACIKLAPTGSNIPAGALKLAAVSGGKQLQASNSNGVFASVGKLMHDADSVDGFHASQSATANNVAVRNASGKLAGDITGNAAGLSATLGTAKGGTGRTDGAAQDVIVPSGSGTGTAKGLGQVGRAVGLGTSNLDSFVDSGFYVGSNGEHTAAQGYPYTASVYAALRVSRASNIISQQLMYGTGALWTRWSGNGGSSWSAWVPYGGQKDSSVYIYLSKSGSDSNTGLDSDKPVLTFARAMRIAAGFKPNSTGGNIAFRFGAGDWGDIDIYGKGGTYYIQAYDGAAATSYSSSMPQFGTLTIRGMNVNIQSVHANVISIRDGGFCWISTGLSRIGRIEALYGGTCLFANSSNAIQVKNISGNSAVLLAQYCGNICLAGSRTMQLVQNITLSNGYLTLTNGGRFFAGSALTFSGSYTVTGRKAYITAGCEARSATAFTSFPGTTAASYGTGAVIDGVPYGGGGTTKFLRADGTWAAFSIPNASASAAGLVSTGAQTFAGNKTFNSDVTFAGRNAGSMAFFNNYSVEFNCEQNVWFNCECVIEENWNIDGTNKGIEANNGDTKNCTLLSGNTYVGLYDRNNSQWIVRVAANKSYIHYGTVQAVSDERNKKDIAAVQDALLDAWGSVQWQQFLYKDVVNDRQNVGLVAQRVETALQAHGITAEDWSFFDHDREEGADQYYIHYPEALSIEAAYMRRRADRLEARMAELEKRIA